MSQALGDCSRQFHHHRHDDDDDHHHHHHHRRRRHHHRHHHHHRRHHDHDHDHHHHHHHHRIQMRKSRFFFFYHLLTAPRTVSNTYAQVARAQSCANHVQHIQRLPRATCRATCHVVRKDSSAIKFDRAEIAFISAWLHHSLISHDTRKYLGLLYVLGSCERHL